MKQLRVIAMLAMLGVSGVRAQDALETLPRNYKLVFENAWVRVVDVNYAAHENLPVHNHSERPTIYVYLTDSGPVRFSHIEEHGFRLIRPPEKAGTFRVSPGRLEKHEVENLGDISTEFLRVELKQVSLGSQATSFRGKRVFDVAHTGAVTEYADRFVTVRRTIAAAGETAACGGMDDPTLMIALTPTLIEALTPTPIERDASAVKAVPLERGKVLWIGPKSSYGLRGADGKTAGHLLQITLQRNSGRSKRVCQSESWVGWMVVGGCSKHGERPVRPRFSPQWVSTTGSVR